MVELECQNCDYIWEYTGDKAAGTYTNCPQCYYKVRVVEDE